MDTQLVDFIRSLPKPLLAYRGAGTLNGSILVYRGPLEITCGGRKELPDGTLTFHWLPSPALRFQTELAPFDFQDNGVTIRIPSQDFEASGFISSASGSEISGVLNGSPRLGHSEPVSAVDFQLSNFHHIIGEAVQTGTAPYFGAAGLRFDLQHPDWHILVDQVTDYGSRIREMKTEGGYVTSHVGRITKPSGGDISVEEADDTLQALQFFFSFARGNWSTPIFPRGRRADATIWERVAAWQVGAWKDVGTWFPTQQPSVGGSAWTGFLNRWKNPELRSPLKLAIHWYIEAVTVQVVAGRSLGAGLLDRRAAMERATKSSGCTCCCWQVALIERIRSA